MHPEQPWQTPETKHTIVSGRYRIPVVASGDGWLVVIKPSGISIHNDPGGDLISAVQAALRDDRWPHFDRFHGAMHAVHRLDRDTSGIVLLAGDSETASFFGEQFASRSVTKNYLAVLHGRLAKTVDDGAWHAWTDALSPAAAGRGNPRGGKPHVESITQWRLKMLTRHYSLVECRPLTGRKHQIRRHAKLAGHPVVGDRRYGSSRSCSYLSQKCHFNRMGLHAHSLTIQLPESSVVRTFRSHGLPASMVRLLEADR